MDNSPLGAIPAELRNQIYVHVFANDVEEYMHRKGYIPIIFWNWGLAGPYRRETRPPALVQVCRKLREETDKFYYASNKFLVPVFFAPDFNANILAAWLRMLGKERTAVLKGVTILLMNCQTTNAMHCWPQLRSMWKTVFQSGLQDRLEIVGALTREQTKEGGIRPALVRRFLDQQWDLEHLGRGTFLEAALECEARGASDETFSRMLADTVDGDHSKKRMPEIPQSARGGPRYDRVYDDDFLEDVRRKLKEKQIDRQKIVGS